MLQSRKSHVYTATLKNGTNAQVKAYTREAAYEYLKAHDSSLRYDDIKRTSIQNSHQAVIGQG